MGIVSDFKEFLNEYKVVGLAVAFVIAVAVTGLVQSLVNNIIMPIVGIFIQNGSWQTATVDIGGANVGWGSFLSSLLNFLIIAFVIFLVVRYVIKEEKADGKKKGKKPK